MGEDLTQRELLNKITKTKDIEENKEEDGTEQGKINGCLDFGVGILVCTVC